RQTRAGSVRAQGHEHRHSRREDGDRVPGGDTPAARGPDAGRGQHPAVRAAAWRRERGPCGDDRLDRGQPACRRGADRGRPGDQRHSPPGGRSGFVTGTSTALSLGSTLASYEVVVTDDDGNRVCTSRITCLI